MGYKNCTNNCFSKEKEKLEEIAKVLIEEFAKELVQYHRIDDLDFLILNFQVLQTEKFGSNLAIIYEDLPGEPTYSVNIIKTLDRQRKRYFKRFQIRQNFHLKKPYDGLLKAVQDAIFIFKSWMESDLTSGDFVELEGDVYD